MDSSDNRIVYRVHYDWFTISDRGEYYFDWTLGYEYKIPGTEFMDIVTDISIKGNFLQRIAIVSFLKGARIEQHNIHSIIYLTPNYTEDETK